MKKHIVEHIPDALLVAGAAMLSYGAWLVYAPAGFLVGGSLMLGGGYLIARSG